MAWCAASTIWRHAGRGRHAGRTANRFGTRALRARGTAGPNCTGGSRMARALSREAEPRLVDVHLSRSRRGPAVPWDPSIRPPSGEGTYRGARFTGLSTVHGHVEDARPAWRPARDESLRTEKIAVGPKRTPTIRSGFVHSCSRVAHARLSSFGTKSYLNVFRYEACYRKKPYWSLAKAARSSLSPNSTRNNAIAQSLVPPARQEDHRPRQRCVSGAAGPSSSVTRRRVPYLPAKHIYIYARDTVLP